MQRQILNDAQNLNLLNDIVKVESINYSADVKNVLVKIGKVQHYTNLVIWILI